MDAVLILAFLGDPLIPPGLPNSGGFNLTLNNLMQNISNYNYDIMIITDTNGLEDRLKKEIFKSNIEIYRINTSQEEVNNQNVLFHSTNRIINETMDIIRHCNRRIKLIHTFYWISGYVGKQIAEKLNIPFIHTVISLFIYRKNAGCIINSDIQFKCEKNFLNNADIVLAITEDEKKLLKKYYGIESKKIYVTGRNVDEIFMHPVRSKNNVPTALESKKYFAYYPLNNRYSEWWKQQAFLYVGRIVQNKGVDIIIKAWVKLYSIFHGNVPALWIVGGSLKQIESMRNHCCTLKKYEKEGKLIWWGYLDAPSISTLLLKSCTLIVHSNYEPGGRVILEAFSQGVPVISTQCGFGKDYIYDGYNGHIVKYGDVEGLLRCMEYYTNNPFLSDPLGNNAKRYFLSVSKHWNYHNFHSELYRHYIFGNIDLPKHRRKLTPDDLNDGSSFTRLTQFPYPDFATGLTVLLQEIFSYTGIRLRLHEAFQQTNDHFIFHKESEYHLRIIYNQLSPDSTWNCFISAKGNSAPRRILKLKDSLEYNIILKPLYVSDKNFFMLSKYEIPAKLSLKECFNLIKEFSKSKDKCICSNNNRSFISKASAFQKTNHFAALPPFSLRVFSEILQYHINLYNINITSVEKLLKLNDLICKTEKDNPQGINYGTAILKNICLSDNQKYLLPTDTWYYGELGADIIDLILEFDEYYLFNHQEPILGISNFRLMLWQSEILLYRLFLNKWNRKKSDEKMFNLLNDTLNYVFSIKCPFNIA